jgi:hypothetical protein
VTGKLIEEPPLLVLPSLARELGLERAIVLQQLHYAGRRAEDGWIERSAADWARALGGTIAARSFERIWPALVDAGWVEARPSAGRPTAYRVTPRTERGVVPAASVGSPPADSGGSLIKREQLGEKNPPKVPEPDGFGDWLEFHHELTGSNVPRAGSKRRERLAGIFAGLVSTGAVLDDFKLESEGVFASPHMREGGHLEPENVLRATRFGKYADVGRRARAARETGVAAKYGHLNAA